MKYLLPLLILIFAFTAFGYNNPLKDLFVIGDTSVINTLDNDKSSSDFVSLISSTSLNSEQLFSVNQANECTYSLSSTSIEILSSGGNASFNITSEVGCAWTAVSNVDWITITSGSSGSGNGTVNFSVQGNFGNARTGTITAGGHIFTVTQRTSCAFRFAGPYALGPITPSADGGSFQPNVHVEYGGPQCTSYTISSNVSWITVSGGTVTVAPNLGPPRSGTVSLSPGASSFTVNQSACTYSVIPSSQTISPAGGTITASVTTQSVCMWKGASLVADWVTVSDNIMTGSGIVTFTVQPNTGATRGALLYIVLPSNTGGTSFIISQPTACSISPTNQSFPVSGGTGSVTVSASGPCNWTAASNSTWITITSGSSGSGAGTVNYIVAPNMGEARTGVVNIAGLSHTITQPGGCTYQLSSNGTSFPGSGGSGTFNVTASDTSCSSTATKNVSWITIDSGESGNGNRTISYTVQANTGPARTGTITVGGQVFNINQASGCSYTLTSTSLNIAAEGGSGSFTINGSAVCSWTAISNIPWITITSGSSGSGSGTVNFSVQPNTGVARSGTITAGGQTFTVNQTAGSVCTYSLSSTSVNISASGGTGTVNVTTGADCSWSALSNVQWITTFASGNNTGNGTITFSVEANSGLARTGTITIAGQIFTINQRAVECDYSLSNFNTNIEVTGGTGNVDVITQAGCSWTAVSNVSWITVTSGTTGNGNGTVNFSVAANTGPARTGTITIAGRTFTVNQANGCAYSLSPQTLQFPTQGGNSTFAVTTNNGCTWTATTTASWITINTPTGTGSGAVSFTISAYPYSGGSRTGTITVGGQSFTIKQDAGPEVPLRAAFDYDGDGKSDFSIYRPSVGEWWYLRSSDGGNAAAQFGTASDKIVPADYTGDRRTDFAFYRKGEWFILRSEDFSYYAFPFGLESDIPVPADYDGDGKADAAVYRPSEKVWYILKSTGGARIEQFGANGDVPVPADYDGDGKTDLAVYSPTLGKWQIQRTTAGATSFQFGTSIDKPVQADYDGDGKADAAYYRPSTNEWFVLRSNGTTNLVQFGTSGDIPVPADYDGDGKTDFAIYRPSTKHWWYAASSANGEQRAREFGVSTDLPLPSAYVP